jgi:hypothetical protein
MFFGTKSRGAPEEKGVPTRVDPEDLTKASVSRAVLKDCLQNPFTILPVAVAVPVAAFGIVAIWPAAVGLGIGLAFVGGSAFVWNWYVNGESRAAALTNQRRIQRRQQVVEDFAIVIDKCKAIGFADGADTASKMREAYSNLLGYLNEHPQSTLDQFRFLAEDTFKQGAATLTLAFDMYKALKSIDQRKLTADLTNLRRQAKVAATVTAAQGEAKALDTKIAELEKRQALVNDKQETINELLAKVTEIESQLQATHLELVELGHEDPTEFLNKDGGAVQRLKSTVKAAQIVEARLRGDDPEQDAKEQKYAQEATEVSPQTTTEKE